MADAQAPHAGERRLTPAEHRAADKARLEAAVAAGELEPTKTYTHYVCPNPECGKSSTWTGSLGPDRCFDGYSSRFCLCCGTQKVEEGPKDHIIEFEQVSAVEHPELFDWGTERARQDVDRSTIPDEWWHTSRCQDSERSIRQQYDGLRSLMAEGEFIRNVRVSVVPEQPIGVDVTTKFEASRSGSSPVLGEGEWAATRSYGNASQGRCIDTAGPAMTATSHRPPSWLRPTPCSTASG